MSKPGIWIESEFSDIGAIQNDSQLSKDNQPILKPFPETSPAKFSLKFHFQVSQDEVTLRVKRAFYPLNYKSFFENGSPDLYGPFWIVTTFIFVLSAASYYQTKSLFSLASSFFFFYFLSAALPGSLYFFLLKFGTNYDLVTLVSLSGYSWSYFIAAGVCSFVPSFLFRVFIWAIAVAGSLFFLRQNLWEEIEKIIPSQKYIVLGMGVVGYLIIFLSTNLYYLGTN